GPEQSGAEQSSSTTRNELDQALDVLRNKDPKRTIPHRRLEEFLSLPMWKYRHELYSNWVATRVIAVLSDQGPTVHSAHGAIRFRFSGTHLATFDQPRPRLHLWTELRSLLKEPVGKGRSAGIQPDI